jgi:aspartate/methionine/tyrosine aminotransferase
VPVVPDGAFYAWADARAACARLGVADSWELSFALMERARLAVTPGRDFGHSRTGDFIRFSTASAMPQLEEAIHRLGRLLG